MTNRYHAAFAALALAALMAAPAAAQSVSGSVAVHGTVSPRCGASLAGDTSFSGTINLGELSQSNGTITSALWGSTVTAPAGVIDFFIGCTSNNFTVRLSATRLTNITTAPPSPAASQVIDYTVEAKIALAEGGFSLVDYTTAVALPAATAATVQGFVTIAAGNFQVRVFGLNPENGPTSILVAGSYDAVITILIAPAP